jgi:hypothetical protein
MISFVFVVALFRADVHALRYFKDFGNAYDAYRSFDFRCESVRAGHFLLYVPADAGFAACVGLGHVRTALECKIAEAVHMRRVAVIPSALCSNSEHNGGVTLPREAQSLARYWDLDSMACVKTWEAFASDLGFADAPAYGDERVVAAVASRHVQSIGRDKQKAVTANGVRESLLQLSTHADFRDVTLLVRSHFGTRHWWQTCTGGAAAFRMRGSMPLQPHFRAAVDAVVREIGRPFVIAFVRRGDKARLMPRIDEITQPQNVANHIRACVPLASHAVYIASDEFRPGFFAPLNAMLGPSLRLFTARNFTDVLRRFVEPNATAEARETAEMERWLFLQSLGVDVSKSDTVEPVLLDNNALFAFETELAKASAAVICTERQRCPRTQKPTHLHELFTSCAWSLEDEIEFH